MQIGQTPALVVIDMQNGFVDERGFMNKIGLGYEDVAACVAPIQRLVAAARAAGLPVFYTRTWLSPDYSDGGLMIARWPAMAEVGACKADSWDAQIVDELAPAPGERIIDKTRYTAFYKTTFEQQLVELGVDSLIVCGCTTEICVESTVRDAFFRGLRITVAEDAVAASSRQNHEDALRVIRFGFGDVDPTDEIVAALAGRPQLVRA